MWGQGEVFLSARLARLMKRIWKNVVNIREDWASYQLNHRKYDLASVGKDYKPEA